MAYSLQSRDLIADGIETMMASQFYDANLAIPGCDKNMPGCIMAMGRVNRPSVMVYGGTIRAGCRPAMEEKLDIISAFQAYGQFVTGQIDDEERLTPTLTLSPTLSLTRQDRRRGAARHCAERVPRPRRVWRHVHGQHDGQRDRGARPLRALLLLHPGVGPTDKA